MPAAIRLRHEHLRAMIDHALEEAPLECCGIVAARDGTTTGIHRAVNLEASPFRFSIDPREYMKVERALDGDGSEVAGFYHSHTGTAPVPSPTDIRAMTGAGFAPPFVHFVVGVADPESPEVRVWYIEDGERIEQEYELAG